MTSTDQHHHTAVRRDGTRVDLPHERLAELDASLRGRLVLPDDPDYDVERLVWNGMIDRRPAIIAKCATADDVVVVLDFAREHDLAMSVRGGGHNAAGVAVCDDGVVIDLAGLDRIDIDPGRGRVRAGGGVTIGALDAATQQHGLAVPMGLVTETGIAGLTLGGGLGWLRRLHGLACDQLVSVELVTADGRIVTASADEHPELFWGVRGGGGNFGIVTGFEFQAFPVGPDVFFAVTIHAGDDTADVVRAYREWDRTAPDEVSSLCVLWRGPEIPEVPAEHHGEPVVVLAAMHAGTPEEGETALAEFCAIGEPVADLSGAMPYLEVQQFFDEDYPKWEKRYYWTSAYVNELDDELIDRLSRLNRDAPSEESTIDIWQLGGAMARVPAEATAFGDRSARFMLGIEANWVDAGDDDANIAWAREVVATAEPWSTGLRYANFPGAYDDDGDVDFFGPGRKRLAILKSEWDPDNVFDRNHNVRPDA